MSDAGEDWVEVTTQRDVDNTLVTRRYSVSLSRTGAWPCEMCRVRPSTRRSCIMHRKTSLALQPVMDTDIMALSTKVFVAVLLAVRNTIKQLQNQRTSDWSPILVMKVVHTQMKCSRLSSTVSSVFEVR